MQTVQFIENHISDTDYKWFAIYTGFRKEKSACKYLNAKGIHTYLPLLQVTKRYQRKIKTYEIPMIQHYVFVNITSQEYVSVLETRDVEGFVKLGKNLIAIPDAEIKILQHICGIVDLEFETIQLQERHIGQAVEIISGGLTGIKGTLVQKLNKSHVLVELNTLACAFKIQVDQKDIRLIQSFGLAI